ncbi:NmrA-like family-domain-containing protein [Lineolata rhizophorae]|uniref:NmrA-like family-domain-containing protein n=1 Tax=Lineolata rhizophorae TaxID=578093 RepID=A0A6A6NUQ9_9PEZI|nr:NmrA-like family-domain-containing protein [Lineolata rhizophorae]
MPARTVVTINSNGRQSASFIRVASAVGWRVRAQLRNKVGIVAQELLALPNVTTVVGELEEPGLIERLFATGPGEDPVELAFINTTHWGDEVSIGRAIADAAKRAGVQHFVYSGMPDHSRFGGARERGWRALPLWASKFAVEQYVREVGLPATFVYCGIYHNNFTSLNYPLFRTELREDGGFVWTAPFHPEDKLPWLDAEHDVGPAVLQIFKEGVERYGGKRIPLAFSHLTPLEACAALSRGLSRPVRYVRGPIRIAVAVPAGYAPHLAALEDTLGRARAPYFGPELERECPGAARELWGGWRDLEEYAREVFPVEEMANGLRWMAEGGGNGDGDGERMGGEVGMGAGGEGVGMGKTGRRGVFGGSC